MGTAFGGYYRNRAHSLEKDTNVAPTRTASPGTCLFRRKRVDEELDEELQYHLEQQIEEGLKAGLGPSEARYAALRVMGAVAQNKEECRDMRSVNYLDDLVTVGVTRITLVVRYE